MRRSCEYQKDSEVDEWFKGWVIDITYHADAQGCCHVMLVEKLSGFLVSVPSRQVQMQSITSTAVPTEAEWSNEDYPEVN